MLEHSSAFLKSGCPECVKWLCNFGEFLHSVNEFVKLKRKSNEIENKKINKNTF